MDPLNWLLQGRLGIELEAGVWDVVSLELMPIFLTTESPVAFGNRTSEEGLTQHSDGLGIIPGFRLGAGFWLNGTALRGSFLRATFLNASYRYETHDDNGKIDELSMTERRLGVLFGSLTRYGPFTIGGYMGLSYALNDQRRCFDDSGVAQTSCKKEVLEIRTNSARYDLLGFIHPFYLEPGLSVGITLD